jgi:hypothetical protein
MYILMHVCVHTFVVSERSTLSVFYIGSFRMHELSGQKHSWQDQSSPSCVHMHMNNPMEIHTCIFRTCMLEPPCLCMYMDVFYVCICAHFMPLSCMNACVRRVALYIPTMFKMNSGTGETQLYNHEDEEKTGIHVGQVHEKKNSDGINSQFGCVSFVELNTHVTNAWLHPGALLWARKNGIASGCLLLSRGNNITQIGHL